MSGDLIEHAYFKEGDEYIKALMVLIKNSVLIKNGRVVEMHMVLPRWSRDLGDIPRELLQ